MKIHLPKIQLPKISLNQAVQKICHKKTVKPSPVLSSNAAPQPAGWLLKLIKQDGIDSRHSYDETMFF